MARSAKGLFKATGNAAKPVVQLMLDGSLARVAGQARGKLWTDHPPARVYVMRWRIDFTGGGAPPMLNAWYVWDGRTREEDVRLLMLDKKDARQGELL